MTLILLILLAVFLIAYYKEQNPPD